MCRPVKYFYRNMQRCYILFFLLSTLEDTDVSNFNVLAVVYFDHYIDLPKTQSMFHSKTKERWNFIGPTIFLKLCNCVALLHCVKDAEHNHDSMELINKQAALHHSRLCCSNFSAWYKCKIYSRWFFWYP